MRKPILTVLFGVALGVALAMPAGATLCERCSGGYYIMNIGTCVSCGGRTGSGAFLLCPACSAKLKQCEHCRGALVAGAQPGDLIIDESANGTVITAQKGQRIVVRLAGNPTTGYQWQCRSVSGRAIEQDGGIRYVAAQPMRAGSGGTYHAGYRGARPGTSRITLTYVRSWETDKPAKKTFQVVVHVVKRP